MQIRRALSFDDVLIEPRYSEVKRGEANVTPKPFKNIAPKIPIISSPMDTVTEKNMITKMIEFGGIGIHHRYTDINNLIEISKEFGANMPLAVGGIKSHKNEINELILNKHKFFCVDIASGHTENGINTIKYIREHVKDADIMTGNITTTRAAEDCVLAGANVLRISIGSGAACTTRINTGIGIPSASSISEIYEFIKHKYNDIILVLDGGIKNGGDLCKALALGADYVIIGRILAGTFESSGKLFIYDEYNKRYEVGATNLINSDNIAIFDINFANEILAKKWKLDEYVKESGSTNKTMHRFVLNILSKQEIPDKYVIDHINHNTLDNRAMNLRICSTTNNNRNSLKKPSLFNYKGIFFRPNTRQWCAKIKVNNKAIYLGEYSNMHDAINAYDSAVVEYFGDFAVTNRDLIEPIKLVKTFRGMASKTALVEKNNKNPQFLHIEGEEMEIPFSGSANNVLRTLIGNIKQSLFYNGAHNLEEFKNSTFIEITNNGFIEGSAHGLIS